MKLVDLEPVFLGGTGEPRRTGVGVQFNCPCGCEHPCFVPFANPLDGGPQYETQGRGWQRTGETFETLSVTPSIQRHEPCPRSWHGFITNGEVITA